MADAPCIFATVIYVSLVPLNIVNKRSPRNGPQAPVMQMKHSLINRLDRGPGASLDK